MIYINEDNIFVSDTLYTKKHIDNNTGYLPLSLYNQILLLSDRRLYKISDYKLWMLRINQRYDDYVVDSFDFTDEFVKINSYTPGEYYEIC